MMMASMKVSGIFFISYVDSSGFLSVHDAEYFVSAPFRRADGRTERAGPL